MLASLTVRDIVLIEKAELEFVPGLNVLTGETGAGKSILLDALGLATGGRGSGRAGLRPGTEQGAASASFHIGSGHRVQTLLDENGLTLEEDIVILRRIVSADGRTRAFVNDQAVGVALAREIGGCLLEVHGQSDDRGLFDANTHRVLLDAFAGEDKRAAEVATLYGAYSAAARRRDEILKARENAAAEIDYLSYAARELAELAPEEGEEEKLASERALLMNAGRIAQDVDAAYQFVAGDGGAELSLSSALRRVSRLGPEGRLVASSAEAALETALALTQEARAALEAVAVRLEAKPGHLENVEERLFALRTASRKFNVQVSRLAALAADFQAKLALLDAGEGATKAADQEVARTRQAFTTAAKALSMARAAAAKELEIAVSRELEPLKMGSARFRVTLQAFTENDAGPGGLERVTFEVATLEGAGFGHLSKIASGGELSRFALALKVALAEAGAPAVLVFDEIDRGVGGAVADAVGERLQRLVRTTQILLVTHSPQVAARGAAHFRISRKADATKVERLSAEERVEEIARMLSGATVTEEARAAARRLLAEAQTIEPVKKKRARAG